MSTTMDCTYLQMNSSKFLVTTTHKAHLLLTKVTSYRVRQKELPYLRSE